ncbi:hypothetical protein D9M69_579960 [compost metagenome]
MELETCCSSGEHVARFLENFFQGVADDQIAALHDRYVNFTLFGDGRADRDDSGARLQPVAEENGFFVS